MGVKKHQTLGVKKHQILGVKKNRILDPDPQHWYRVFNNFSS
jgi:hypothetical protein